MDLPELLERCRRGDELAWEVLVRRYQARAYGLALHYVRDAEEARDLAQEIFVRIYRNLGKLPDHEMFLPWLIRLGRNICLDHLRRAKVRPSGFSVPIDKAPVLRDTAPTPEAAFATDASKRLIHEALQRLSAANREMILLKDIEGLELKEIASLLGLPIGTVKSRSNRARVELARAVLSLQGATS